MKISITWQIFFPICSAQFFIDFSSKSQRFPGPLEKSLDGPLWIILNFKMSLWEYRNIEVLKTTPFRTHLDSFAEPPLWIILSFQLYINNNGNEAHDCGTMRLCELYWISPCLSELRGKLRFSKQHRFGLIFWVFLFSRGFFLVFAFCFCFFLFLFLTLLLICSSCARFDLKQKQRHTPLPPSKKRIYIYIYIYM